MFTKSCAKATDQNRQELFMDSLLGDFQKMKEKALNQQQERRSKKENFTANLLKKQKSRISMPPLLILKFRKLKQKSGQLMINSISMLKKKTLGADSAWQSIGTKHQFL